MEQEEFPTELDTFDASQLLSMFVFISLNIKQRRIKTRNVASFYFFNFFSGWTTAEGVEPQKEHWVTCPHCEDAGQVA